MQAVGIILMEKHMTYPERYKLNQLLLYILSKKTAFFPEAFTTVLIKDSYSYTQN